MLGDCFPYDLRVRRLAGLVLACGLMIALPGCSLHRHDDALWKACDKVDAPTYGDPGHQHWVDRAQNMDGWPQPANPAAKVLLKQLSADIGTYGLAHNSALRRAARRAAWQDIGHLYDVCKSGRLEVQALVVRSLPDVVMSEEAAHAVASGTHDEDSHYGHQRTKRESDRQDAADHVGFGHFGHACPRSGGQNGGTSPNVRPTTSATPQTVPTSHHVTSAAITTITYPRRRERNVLTCRCPVH